MVSFTFVSALLFRDEPIAVFAISIYMMTMSIVSGRWAKELSYPYIYLIPESSYKKLLYMIKSEVPTIVAESILCCLPVYIFCQIGITDVIAMMLSRISFAFLLISVNLLLKRLFGESDKKNFIVLFYFLLVLAFSLPGIMAAVAVFIAMPFYLGISLSAMGLVNTVTAFAIAFACRKILEYV
jgi:hypothetical protein